MNNLHPWRYISQSSVYRFSSLYSMIPLTGNSRTENERYVRKICPILPGCGGLSASMPVWLAFLIYRPSIFKRAKRMWSVPYKKRESSIPPFFGMKSNGAVITTNQSRLAFRPQYKENAYRYAYRYKCHHAHVTLLSKLLIDKKLIYENTTD